MKVMLLGAGAVGEAYAVLTAKADPHGQWLKKLVVADFVIERAREVCKGVGGGDRFPAVQVDAGDRNRIVEVVRQNDIDLILNGCPQSFDEPIFDAAFTAGCHYMDMAMSLSERHPAEPFRKVGGLLGDYQFARHKEWEEKGRLALLGMGIDPGVSEVFAAYADKYLFDEIDEIGIRDGSNISMPGCPYATGFSVWSVIEECLNPPVFWEKSRGHYTGDPMSEPEVFDFPGGIGPLEVVAIEHEEVINIPRWIQKGLKKVTFKISLGKELMEALKMLDQMGLAHCDPVNVKGVEVVPRDVVEACLPDPARTGHQMRGKISVGTWVKGRKDGREREIYLYQVSDNEACMQQFGCQAVAAQTASGPAIATELLAKGIWKSSGVLPPEAFDPDPFMARMAAYGFSYDIRDSWKKPQINRPVS
ncbi:MAG: saccharopine dehydrogenase C-terminal domain-containing protein [Thermodesulfobacteriota bacterium]|nr:saccharopine dehydrogenase C-terminal domain-containing protein [Thermodesulfobacteriota bacterium]